MTAAGTVTPAQVLVLGAGVAGLQAIATSRRLGAVVSAYDVRPASADEVRSMGATFIQLELEALEGAGGYAREMTEDRAGKATRAFNSIHSKITCCYYNCSCPWSPSTSLDDTSDG